MKKLLFILSLLVSVHSFSQQLGFQDSCNTILWGIINGTGDTSYLLGTFHEFGNAFFDAHPPLRTLYNRADCIATENDMKRVKVAGSKMSKLSRKDKHLVKKYLAETHSDLTMGAVRHLPASSVAYFLLHELYIIVCNTHQAGDVAVMDEYIANGAITAGKKLVGLESVTDTFDVINKLMGAEDNYDTKATVLLRDIITHTEKYRDSVRKDCEETDNYKKQTINYRFSKRSTEDYGLYADVLDKRNDAWMKTIPQLVDDHKAFIAVGLKHLFYQHGLIMLLKEKGYTLFPVPLTRIDNFHYLKK